MKTRVLFFMLFLPLMASAQDKVITEVAGIKFGSSYAVVKDKLERLLGPLANNEYNKINDAIYYEDVSYQDYTFDVMMMKFAQKRDVTLLDYVSFISMFATQSEASQTMDKIADSLSKSHTIYQLDNGYLAGGISPLDKDDYGFLLFVKETSTGSKDRYPYSVILKYGPYGYGK